jgi:hypothetical protein
MAKAWRRSAWRIGGGRRGLGIDRSFISRQRRARVCPSARYNPEAICGSALNKRRRRTPSRSTIAGASKSPNSGFSRHAERNNCQQRDVRFVPFTNQWPRQKHMLFRGCYSSVGSFGRFKSSNEGTWLLSRHASSVVPHILQNAAPVCGTKNLVSVRLYLAPQLHSTIVAIRQICAAATLDQARCYDVVQISIAS